MPFELVVDAMFDPSSVYRQQPTSPLVYRYRSGRDPVNSLEWYHACSCYVRLLCTPGLRAIYNWDNVEIIPCILGPGNAGTEYESQGDIGTIPAGLTGRTRRPATGTMRLGVCQGSS